MNVFIDIETIPGQGLLEKFVEAEKENFKAPSSLTKTQACADLGLTGDAARYTSKDDAIAMWEKKFSEEKAPEVAEEKWRKTSLDGGTGEVISIAFSTSDSEVFSVHREINGSEEVLLNTAFSQIKALLNKKVPVFVGHNVKFDLKFLFHRCVILGVKPPFKLPFYGRHESHFFDNMQAWCGYGERISQDNLCNFLGIDGKPDDIDGSKVWDFVRDGMIDRVVEYNKNDVDTARKVYQRITFQQ